MKRLLLFLIACAPASAQWSNGYTYKATYVVQSGKVTGTQSNFTVVVAGTASGLKTVANSGHVQNTCTQTLYGLTVPADLIFTSDSAGTSLLHWQFDTYSATTGAYSAHVLVPNIDTSTNNTLYMWYGRSLTTTWQGGPAPAVWDGNTVSALVLPTSGASLYTADYKGNTVTSVSGGATAGAGMNSGAAVFSGSLSSPSTIEITTPTLPKGFTTCVWFNTAGAGSGNFRSLVSNSNGNDDNISLAVRQGPYTLVSNVHYGSVYTYAASTEAVIDNAWHQGCQVDSSTGGANGAGQLSVYVDGRLTGTVIDFPSSALALPSNNYVALGRYGSYTNDSFLNGSLAEFELSNIVRSPNWIAARYNNVESPSAFWSSTYDLTSGIGGSATFTFTPTTIPSGYNGQITLTLVGSGTSWSKGTTAFTVGGATLVSQSVTGTTAAIVVVTAARAGTLSIVDMESGVRGPSATGSIVDPAFAIDVNAGNLRSTQTLLLTGQNTLWSSVPSAGLFTISGGSGASIGTPTITSNTAGVIALTTGTAPGVLTITDTSTGKTAVFLAVLGGGSGSGGGACASVGVQ